MFEHYHQPLLPRQAFFMRMLGCVVISLALLVTTLLIGVLAFHGLEHYSWIDALLNSVMIMTGIGVISVSVTSSGKIFTALYAILSTLTFFAIVGILVAPLLHRLLHNLHVKAD
jgi:hypothetical protein